MQDNAVPQPVTGASSPQFNNGTSTTREKVAISPFPHLKKGISSLIKNNLSAVLVAILVSTIVSVGLTIAFMYAIYRSSHNLFFGSMAANSSGSTVMKILAIFIGVAILAALVVGYFGSVINRIIITGSRDQKEELGHAFSFVGARLPKIVQTYLLIIGIFIAGEIVLFIVGRFIPILAILLGLVAIIAAIIFAFRISYLPLILVDDENPGRPFDVIRRSSTLWAKSAGAIVVYALVWLAIYVVLNILLNGHNSSEVSTYNTSPNVFTASSTAFRFGIGAVLVTSFISNCFGALVFSGGASIYNEARELVDGHRGGKNSKAPLAPAPGSPSHSPLPPNA